MTGRAAVSLLPVLLASVLAAADSAADAARELARRIQGPFKAPFSFSIRNLSDLGPSEVAEVRRGLETGLRSRGVTLAETGAPDEIRVTVSQNFAGYLLVAEVQRGDERQVLMLPCTRPAGAPPSAPATVRVEKTSIATLADPILDAAKIESDWLLLQPGQVVRLRAADGHWEAREAVTFGPLMLPRDVRGRLIVEGGAYLAYLPGTICSGAIEPLEVRCREADEPWPLPLRAYLARGRNYFEPRNKTVPAFYAATETIFTRLDGRAYLQDSGVEAASPLGASGSDLAGLQCGTTTIVLATRPGDSSEKDAVRVLEIVDRQAVEAAAPLDMPGAVTALWPIDENSAVAVARDIGSGEYAAYRLAVSCSH